MKIFQFLYSIFLPSTEIIKDWRFRDLCVRLGYALRLNLEKELLSFFEIKIISHFALCLEVFLRNYLAFTCCYEVSQIAFYRVPCALEVLNFDHGIKILEKNFLLFLGIFEWKSPDKREFSLSAIKSLSFSSPY